MTNHWIAVASRDHVLRGIAGGFCQVCHGKLNPLKRMSRLDWIVYYSPTKRFGTKPPCRAFTAIGRVYDENAYQCYLTPDFIPWRLKVSFLQGKEAPIEPIIDRLTFIKDKKRWGFPFRHGCFSVSQEDFAVIAEQMSVFIGSM